METVNASYLSKVRFGNSYSLSFTEISFILSNSLENLK
jgi:hypothetical protein